MAFWKKKLDKKYDHYFSGNITVVDRNENGKVDDTWLILEEEVEDDMPPMRTFLACDEVIFGDNMTSLEGLKCGKVTCQCQKDTCSIDDCYPVDSKGKIIPSMTEIKLAGFRTITSRNLAGEDAIPAFDRQRILSANSEKMDYLY
jgi:hypothetical protein